ncbi:tyrosine-type recombinase/integrase [Micromonospora tulbaghiae]|uniref:tyrosine-type recombinase/integrase n=1 Tax=Micromonospora tulbaghiae TaxID=479978 RepID=UPI0033D635C5
MGLVFASTIGTAMEPRNVNRRFDQLRAAAGLDWLHLHDLRHAFATFLLDQGEELRTVMELLGHSTIRMTADTYGHLLPARARQAASAIDRILGEEGRHDRLAVLGLEINQGKCWWSPGDSNP